MLTRYKFTGTTIHHQLVVRILVPFDRDRFLVVADPSFADGCTGTEANVRVGAMSGDDCNK
jgi:hypothetical protein